MHIHFVRYGCTKKNVICLVLQAIDRFGHRISDQVRVSTMVRFPPPMKSSFLRRMCYINNKMKVKLEVPIVKNLMIKNAPADAKYGLKRDILRR